MRMHRADYAVARCLSVRPSVCHTPVGLLSLNGYTYRQSFFHRRVAHHSSFSIPNKMAIFRRGSPEQGRKSHDFRPISRFISQMMQDRAIVTMEGE